MKFARVAALILIGVCLSAPAVADPYPPLWNGGAGAAIHFAPVTWPSDASWIPYLYQSSSLADAANSDPSNGGTSPQNYVNVSSGCTDQTLPSVYYYYDAAKNTLFFRWRVGQIANTYATGPTPGTFASTDPWNSALWTVLIDVDGDGYREFAVHLNGSSGSPSTSVDVLSAIYSNTRSQSIDYINDPNIHLLFHNPTAFVDSATNRILNFHNSLTPDANWPNGSNESVWDYGTTRATKLTSSCIEYFIDYQIPLTMLDATSVGGPKVTASTPMSFLFTTANSLNNPLQKDVVLQGSYIADPSQPLPFGDPTPLGSGPTPQPIVTAVTAAGCGPVSLTATIIDTITSAGTTTVSAADFYSYLDSNGNGLADDSSSWTFAAAGTASTSQVGLWTASWNSSALIQGRYLIGVKATDAQGHITWSFLTQAQAGVSPPNYANPSTTGLVWTSFVNSCGTPPPSLTKSASPSQVTVGQPVTFTLTLSNTTTSPITVTSLSDSLPSGFTFSSNGAGTLGVPTTSPAPGATGTISWTFSPAASVPASSSRTLIFTAAAPVVAGTFSNTASAVTSFATLNSNSVQVSVGTPRLTMAKSASVTSAAPGSSIAYTITYGNDSPVNITGITISDTLPAGLTFVSSPTGTYNAGTRVISWTIGSIASGDGPFTVTYTASVDSPFPSAAAIPVVNSATITSNEASPASASASVYVSAPRPRLVIQKDNSAGATQIAAGASTTFTLSYANVGTAAATSVTLTDTIPAGFTFVSATGGGTAAAGVVTWNLGSVAAGATGSVQVTLTAATPFTSANPAVNSISLSSAQTTPVSDTYTIGITQTSNICSTYYFRTTTANVGFDGTQRIANTTPVLAADTGLGVLVTTLNNQVFAEALRFYQETATPNDVTFAAGTNITTNIYIDRGPGQGITLRGTLYDYDDLSGTKTSIGTGSQSFNGSAKGLFTFTIAVASARTLVRGHRLLWIFEVASNNNAGGDRLLFQFGGTVANTESGSTPATFANSRSDFCVTPPASLVFDKVVNNLSVAAGGTLQYTLRFANIGQSSATGVQIVDTLPAGVSFASATLNGAPFTPAISGQQLTFSIGTLAGAASGTLVINATVAATLPAGTTILTNSATLQSTQTSPITDSISTGVVLPSISVTKSADRTLLIPGDTVHFTITALNSGTAAGSNVTFTDVMPVQVYFTYVAGTAKLNGSAIADPAGSTLTVNGGSLAIGAIATVTFDMRVATSGVPSGTTTLTNSASVAETASGTTTSNIVTLSISTNPNLRITKTSSPVSPAAGSNITYTISVTNIGSGDALGVLVRDVVPSSTTYAAGTMTLAAASLTDLADGDAGAFDASTNQIVVNAGTITAGATKVVTFAAKVNTPLPAGSTTITNTATVSASNASTKTTTNTTSATASPSLAITKSGATSVAWPLTTLSSAAAGSTTVNVVSSSLLSTNARVAINGTVVVINAINGNQITVSAPVTAAAGMQVIPVVQYVIDYSNNGSATATSVQVQDVLPAGLAFAAATPAATSAPAIGSSGTVTWSIGSLPIGTFGMVRVYAYPTAVGTYTDTATISSAQGSATSIFTTVAGTLVPVKVTSTPSITNSVAGTTAAYTITVTNQRSVTATGVQIIDTLSSGFSYKSTTSITGGVRTSTLDPVLGDQQPRWGTFDVPAGGSVTVTFDVNVAPSVGRATYQNDVTATSVNASTTTFDFLGTIAEDVSLTVADVSVLKSASATNVNTGQPVTFTITAANAGPDIATGVVVQDLLPAGISFVSATPSQGSYNSATGVWTVGSINPASTATLSIATTITAAGSLTNTAEVIAATQFDPDSTPNNHLSSEDDQASVTITSTAVNQPPVAVNDSYSTPKNVGLSVAAPGVMSNDSDPDGNPLTVTGSTAAAHGAVAINANGSFTYTPALNYTGADAFTYTISDGSLTATATVNLIVTATNAAPTAVNDSYSTAEDTTLTIAAPGVLSNDTDPDGDPLTVTTSTSPSHGTVGMSANGSFTYTPAANYNGSDSFTYTISDGLLTSTATVNLTITPVNDPPVAVDDSYSTGKNVALTVVAPGVLANDIDVDGNPLTVISSTVPSHGTVTANADGSFTYTPALNYSGSDSFTYTISDGALTATATVNLTITPSNAAPTAINDSYSTAEDTPLTIAGQGVLSNDTDPDNDPLTVTTSTAPLHGTLTINANGSFTYTPAANYNGPDSFTYTISDGTLTSTATVNLTITPVNDPPVAVNDNYTTSKNNALTIAAPGVLTNDSDIDGGALTIVSSTVPSHGTVTANADGSFTYTPALNYSGSDSFTYTISDGSLTASATVNLTVTPSNAAPTAINDSYSTAEDTPLTIAGQGVLSNDTDPDNDPLTVTTSTAPLHGTLTINANGSFTYTPAANYNGPDSFTYTISDGSLTSTATVNLTVTPVNDPPVAVNDSYTTSKNNALTIAAPGVLVNDSDIDGGALTVVSSTAASHGTVTANADGSFTYTPALNYSGADSFTYTISDGSLTATATVNLTVTPSNAAPTAINDSYSTAEDTPLTIAGQGVLSNDTDPDNDPLTVTTSTAPLHGTLTINANGSFTYTPAANYNGPDSFTYTISDGSLTSTATVNLTITPVNDPPVAVNDSYSTSKNNALTIAAPGVLSNDSDIDGGALTVVSSTAASHGTVTANADGSFTYTPALNYSGPDSFTYTISDGSLTATATVNLTVTPSNAAPTAINDSYSTAEDTPLTIAGQGVLSNDTDPDNDPLTVTTSTAPLHGTLTINANGSFTYTPAANYNGPDSFTYTISDGSLMSTATVNLTVTPVNDPPVAVNDSYTTSKNNALTIAAPGVLTNDSDIDGGALTVVSSTAASHGTVTANADGSFTYTPALNYSGADSFTYTISDGSLTATATVNLTITPSNAAPTAINDSYSTAEDTTLTIAAPGVLANDTDPDGDPLTVTTSTSPSHGTVAMSANGSFTYTPAANYNGPDAFTYTISDGSLTSTATVNLTVTPVNDPPVAVDDSYSTAEGTALTIAAPGILVNDSDPDADALTVISSTSPSHGTITVNANGSLTYTPSAGYWGLDSLSYTAGDGHGGTATATIHLTITQTPQPLLAASKIAAMVIDADNSFSTTPGDTLEYTITVQNNGSGPATAVVINDTPDPNTLLVTGSVITTGIVVSGNTAGDSSASVSIGTLLPGSSTTVKLRVRIATPFPAAVTSVKNQAFVTSNEGGSQSDDPSTPATGDPTSTPVVPTAPPATSDVAISKSVDQSHPFEGSTITYTLSATNVGAIDVAGVTASDILPNGTAYVGSSATAGTYDPSTGIWQVGTLTSGSTATLTIRARVAAGTAGSTITNCATVNAADSNAANDRACASFAPIDVPSTACGNQPPVISAPALQSIAIGDTLRFLVAGLDPDGDPVTLRCDGLPSNAHFDERTGEFVFSPADLCDAEDDVYAPVFVARDSRGAETSIAVSISVGRRYRPRMRAVNRHDTATGQPIISMPVSPSNAPHFKVVAASGQANCATRISLIDTTAGMFDETTGVFTSHADRQGRVASFRATDCAGRQSDAAIALSFGSERGVVAVSKAKFDATMVASESPAFTLSVTNEGSAPLIVRSARIEKGRSFVLEGASQFPVVLAPARALPLRIAFVPQQGGTITDTLTIVTDDPAHRNVSIALEGLGVAGDRISSGRSSTDALSKPYVNRGAILAVGPSVSNGATCANHAPSISVPPAVVAEVGKTLRFAVAGIDPDGDAISLGVASLPAGAAFDSLHGIFTFTPQETCNDEADPSQTVTFVAVDNGGFSSSAPVHITIVSAGSAINSSVPIISVPQHRMFVTGNEPLHFRAVADAGPDCAVTLAPAGDYGRYDEPTGEFVVTPNAINASSVISIRATSCTGSTSTAMIPIERGDAVAFVPSAVRRVEFLPARTGSSQGYAVVSLVNRTSLPMPIAKVALADGSSYRIDGVIGLPVVLGPGQELPVRVVFEPKAAKAVADRLLVWTSDPALPALTIELAGEGTN
jgi:uncharacterized repeat protein (TIGR01451 family)